MARCLAPAGGVPVLFDARRWLPLFTPSRCIARARGAGTPGARAEIETMCVLGYRRGAKKIQNSECEMEVVLGGAVCRALGTEAEETLGKAGIGLCDLLREAWGS